MIIGLIRAELEYNIEHKTGPAEKRAREEWELKEIIPKAEKEFERYFPGIRQRGKIYQQELEASRKDISR